MLKRLPEDMGGNVIIAKNMGDVISVKAGSEAELYDIDTTEDMEKIMEYM